MSIFYPRQVSGIGHMGFASYLTSSMLPWHFNLYCAPPELLKLSTYHFYQYLRSSGAILSIEDSNLQKSRN
jgi:hypothetical protein